MSTGADIDEWLPWPAHLQAYLDGLCDRLNRREEREDILRRLVDPCDAAALVGAVDEVLAAPLPAAGPVHRPELWDGHAAKRLVAVIAGSPASRLPPADKEARSKGQPVVWVVPVYAGCMWCFNRPCRR